MSERPSADRRAFLTGNAAIRALRAALPQTSGSENEDSDGAGARTWLVEVSRKAMACEFQVLLNAGEHDGAVEGAVEALESLESLEQQMTTYRDSSELQVINRLASKQACPVEPRLFGLLQHAVRLSELTGGAFDITSAPLSEVWGFPRREGRYPTEDEMQAARERVGYRHLELDASRRTVRFLRPGMRLHLGSIGKGFALDRIAELLVAHGISDFLVHGGQSSLLARGKRRGRDADTGGWPVAIRHPYRDDTILGHLSLSDLAAGTSGHAHQFFHYRGRRLGHVLDPRSGLPAEELWSATALAQQAAEADALATAFFVMGPDESTALCRRRPDLGCILVRAPTPQSPAEVLVEGQARQIWTPVQASESPRGSGESS